MSYQAFNPPNDHVQGKTGKGLHQFNPLQARGYANSFSPPSTQRSNHQTCACQESQSSLVCILKGGIESLNEIIPTTPIHVDRQFR